MLTRTLSQGNSQSGCYQRDFIYSGFNADEGNRPVFDGSIPTVASGRMFLNYRFAPPGRINPAGHGLVGSDAPCGRKTANQVGASKSASPCS